MSQYLIDTERKVRTQRVHGNDQNKITGTGANTNYDASSFTPPETPQQPTDSQAQAKARAQNYSKISNAEHKYYDAMFLTSKSQKRRRMKISQSGR